MIAGYILTGGKSRRMDGKAKLFLEYQGVSFYEHIRKALAPFSEVYLSIAKGKEDLYSSVPLPKITDIYPDIGPLGGIYSGLKVCRGADALFVTACDTPLICRDAVEKIAGVYDGDKKIIVAQTKDRIHPLFGIYPQTVLPVIEQMIAEKRYKMQELLSRTDAVKVPFGEDSQIDKNINTLFEYENLCK